MTSLSTGLLIYDILSKDTAVKAITTKVFPVVAEENVALPYICYRRSSNMITDVKGSAGADSCMLDIVCFSSSYAGSIQLAEAVRNALDGVQASLTSGGATLTARGIHLVDSQEVWSDGAYAQSLTFKIRIN